MPLSQWHRDSVQWHGRVGRLRELQVDSEATVPLSGLEIVRLTGTGSERDVTARVPGRVWTLPLPLAVPVAGPSLPLRLLLSLQGQPE